MGHSPLPDAIHGQGDFIAVEADMLDTVQRTPRSMSDDEERDESRSALLRSLHLEIWEFNNLSCVSDDLVRVITNAQDLQTIWLDYADDLLTICDGLTNAFGSLRNLHCVTLHATREQGTLLLESMQSPVTSVTISFDEDFWSRGKNDNEAGEAATLFDGFAEYLIDLKLVHPPSLSAYDGFQYPRVDLLSVETYYWDTYDLADLTYTFPNLTRLRLDGDNTDSIDVDERRLANMESEYHWTSLHSLIADELITYSLALGCPVRFWGGVQIGAEVQLSRLWTCLNDIQPMHLSIMIFFSGFSLDALSRIFPVAETSHLRVCLYLNHCTLDMFQALDKFIESLENLSLVFLALEFDHDSFRENAKLEIPDPIDNFLLPMGAWAFVHQLAERLPQVKYIHFLCKQRQYDVLWEVSWRPRIGSPGIEEITGDARKKVLEESPFTVDNVTPTYPLTASWDSEQ
ncbi:hypothetical protein EUX98_g869 [Antrodiella citrinella]|uniref:F-box domain-containing protein n=1 Tax=Antrodiella citrinella TaxID=2447956 RepID=A0A4S4N5P2_9APHY|nr:hypothetical protein EUX98_g869 [Antrodiella citrinella]